MVRIEKKQPWYRAFQVFRSQLFGLFLLAVIAACLFQRQITSFDTVYDSLHLFDDMSLWNNETTPSSNYNTIVDSKRVLVGYSGPTSMKRSEGKNELYLLNFDFFLKHGVDCRHQDTAIALTEQVHEVYKSQLESLQQDCQAQGHVVYVFLREEQCHDLATVYTLFYNSSIPTSTYDYFIYINCGTTGPSPHLEHPWAHYFLRHLSDQVKMSGLSVNCFRKNSPHVQSMAYALDRQGLDLVLKSESIFDCLQQLQKDTNKFNKIVIQYERGMSRAILDGGYGLAGMIWPGIVFWHNRTNCTLIDSWGEANLRESFEGRLPSLNETVFFKTSRLLPKEIAELIDYPGEPTWHAD